MKSSFVYKVFFGVIFLGMSYASLSLNAQDSIGHEVSAKPVEVDLKPVSDALMGVENGQVAVVKANVVSSGIKGYFAYKGKQANYFMPDRMSQDLAVKFTGKIMRHIAKKGRNTTTFRLDQNLMRKIDHRKKRYEECPIKGACKQAGAFFSDEYDQENEEVDECPATLLKNEISLKPTGEKREIKGLQAEQYHFSWLIESEDLEGNKQIIDISSDDWIAPGAGNPQVKAIIDQYEGKLQTLMGYSDYVSQTNFPSEVALVITNYMASIAGSEHESQLKSSLSSLPVVNGLLVSSRFNVEAQGELCVEQKEPKEKERKKLDFRNGAGGLLGSLAKRAASDEVERNKKIRKARMKKRPLFKLIYELDSIGMETVDQKKFEVPANYTLVDRK